MGMLGNPEEHLEYLGIRNSEGAQAFDNTLGKKGLEAFELASELGIRGTWACLL